jgi:hypothetical protein
LLGETDRRFGLMEAGLQRGDRLILAMGIDRELDSYRSDPRYVSILEKVGHAGFIRP